MLVGASSAFDGATRAVPVCLLSPFVFSLDFASTSGLALSHTLTLLWRHTGVIVIDWTSALDVTIVAVLTLPLLVHGTIKFWSSWGVYKSQLVALLPQPQRHCSRLDIAPARARHFCNARTIKFWSSWGVYKAFSW
jgi:hypothetical protein